MAKKGPGLFGSLIGMLIGLGLVVLASPFFAWQSQSQDRAKEFQTAEIVAADSVQNGYIVIEDDTREVDSLTCPRTGDVHRDDSERVVPSKEETGNEEFVLDLEDENDYIFEEDEAFNDALAELDTNVVENAKEEVTVAEEIPIEKRTCLAITTVKETYSAKETETCGEVGNDQIVIKRLEDQCDEDGRNCSRCYLVKEFDWANTSTDRQFARFAIGAYTISPNSDALLVGTESFEDYVFEASRIKPIEGDVRFRFTFLPLAKKMLVAGNADAGLIQSAFDGKPYVVSNTNFEGTLENLKGRDKAASFMFIVLSFLAAVIGMVLIVGPITYLTNILRFIPIVGKHADRGFDGIIKFFAVIVGIVIWALIFAIVVLLKNLIAVIIVLLVIGLSLFILAKKGKIDFVKKEDKKGPKND